MTPDQFNALQAKARDLYSQQEKRGERVSLDAIFIALSASSDGSVRKAGDDAPPAWFAETVDRLRGTNERFTTGRFLMLAGRFPAERSESLAVGRWLRELGLIPKKTGGQNVFWADELPKA